MYLLLDECLPIEMMPFERVWQNSLSQRRPEKEKVRHGQGPHGIVSSFICTRVCAHSSCPGGRYAGRPKQEEGVLSVFLQRDLFKSSRWGDPLNHACRPPVLSPDERL